MSTGTSNGTSALLRSYHDAILLVRLAGQEYGLPVSSDGQIVEMITITQLPHTPPSLQGVIKYHGQLVPVLDMRIHLGLPIEPYDLHTPNCEEVLS
jgi:purine-binding chemotaxis protein CheW